MPVVPWHRLVICSHLLLLCGSFARLFVVLSPPGPVLAFRAVLSLPSVCFWSFWFLSCCGSSVSFLSVCVSAVTLLVLPLGIWLLHATARLPCLMLRVLWCFVSSLCFLASSCFMAAKAFGPVSGIVFLSTPWCMCFCCAPALRYSS